MKSNTLHVGYPKTATTFLQQQLFPAIPANSYRILNYNESRDLLAVIAQKDPLDYAADSIKERLRELNASEPVLASYEGLTGIGFFNKHFRSHAPNQLKAAGFDRIIITIRNQPAMLDSLYRQYIQSGGVVPYKKAIDWEQNYDVTQCIDPRVLNYWPLIKNYMEIFGDDNVLVLPFEWLNADAPAFQKALSVFLGCDIPIYPVQKRSNQSLSDAGLNVLRVLNHFTFNRYKPNQLLSNRITSYKFRRLLQQYIDPYLLRPLSNKTSFVTKADELQLRSLVAPGNNLLASYCDLELAALGYPC